MKRINSDSMEVIQGGVSRDEYCGQLQGWFSGMMDGSFDYQGDIGWFLQNFSNNCGNYGYTLW